MLVLLVLAASLARAQQPTLSDLKPAAPADASSLTASRELMDAGHFREAEAALRTFLAQNDLSAEAHSMLGYSLLRQDKPRESLTEYTRAAALERPSGAMLESVGQDYVLLEDWPDADKWTLRAVQMDPKNADAWYSLGRIRYNEQRFRDSLSCFQKVLTLAPKSVKAENNLGLTYEALNETDAAVIAYRQAVAWQEAGPAKERSEQPLLNLAVVLLHRGNLSEAEPLLKQAATLSPNDSHIHEQLGHLYLQGAEYEAAEHEFERACELSPDSSGLHFLLGQAYRHLGQTKEAQAQFAISQRLANASATPKTR
jgi:tetratricopeptide (TPR) repeat protein